MKTTIVITLFNLICATKITAQEFKIHMADTPQPNYTIPGSTNSNSYSKSNYYYTEPIKIESAVQPIQSTETRVTGYYEEGYGTNLKWLTISLKLTVTTNTYGKDEITVKAYKNSNSDYWSDVNFSTVSKTYGNRAKEFTYQVYVASKTVYFSI